MCYNNNVRCVVTYAYDALNQLIRENNPDTGKTYVYSYDTAENILSAKTYAYTTGALGTPLSEDVYAYTDVNWGDKLTSYNGVSFTYDVQGNPLTYYNGENYTFTWQNGRQLASTSKGTTNVTYKYNSDGIRYEKTVNGVVHKYYLNGSTITAETIVNGDDVTYIEYFYDTLGAHSFSLNGTMYFYIKNLQGDVMHIATADNTIVASYTYDAWGNIESVTGTLADTVGTINPIRYRGYYYDNETGLYYLNARYYDSEIGRFINADSLIAGIGGSTHGYNVFAYCFNNPVNMFDSAGDWPKWIEDAAGWVNDKIIQPAFSMGKNVINAAIDSVELKAGLGFGIGVDISNNIKAEFSRDTYIGVDDGELILGNVVATEISLLDSDMKVGDTYDHLSEKGGKAMTTSGLPSDGPLDMIHYPDVTKGNEFAFGPLVMSNSGDILISLSFGIHAGPGGFVSAGFNFTEFFKRIFD